MRSPVLIGLTGSVGMGKSTTAQIFARHGVAIWDADAAVHRLYAAGGTAVAPIKERFPVAVIDDAVDRETLKSLIVNDKSVLKVLETIVHPLVAADRATFLRDRTEKGDDILLFDIPLLFETGAESQFDVIVVASAPAPLQEERVMARPGMTRAHFLDILARQLPDSEKRRRADFIVDTTDMDKATRDVDKIMERIKSGLNDA